MEVILQVLIGIGLSATCGFRIFVPLLVAGLAGMNGYLEFSSGFDWIASYPAVIIFGVATLIEIIAYFIPYIDNLLNAVSLPISIIAGIILTASVITDIHPILQWSLAIIAGGGVATVTSLVSNGTHAASTALSGGVANPAVSAAESGVSMITAVLAIVLPVLVVLLLILLVVVAVRLLRKYRERKNRPAS